MNLQATEKLVSKSFSINPFLADDPKRQPFSYENKLGKNTFLKTC